jgi:hypothetical protein
MVLMMPSITPRSASGAGRERRERVVIRDDPARVIYQAPGE